MGTPNSTNNTISLLLSMISIVFLTAGYGCGDLGPCIGGGDEELHLSLDPSSIASDQEAMMVASFERDVFMNGPVRVHGITGFIEDAAGSRIGGFWYSKDFDGEWSLSVDGAILDADVVDARSVELSVSLPAHTANETVEVTIIADDGGVECSRVDIGTAPLEVR